MGRKGERGVSRFRTLIKWQSHTMTPSCHIQEQHSWGHHLKDMEFKESVYPKLYMLYMLGVKGRDKQLGKSSRDKFRLGFLLYLGIIFLISFHLF